MSAIVFGISILILVDIPHISFRCISPSPGDISALVLGIFSRVIGTAAIVLGVHVKNPRLSQVQLWILQCVRYHHWRQRICSVGVAAIWTTLSNVFLSWRKVSLYKCCFSCHLYSVITRLRSDEATEGLGPARLGFWKAWCSHPLNPKSGSAAGASVSSCQILTEPIKGTPAKGRAPTTDVPVRGAEWEWLPITRQKMVRSHCQGKNAESCLFALLSRSLTSLDLIRNRKWEWQQKKNRLMESTYLCTREIKSVE